MLDDLNSSTPRRGFIGKVTAAAMGLGVAGLVPEGAEAAVSHSADAALNSWFGKLTGKHRVVFDATEPNSGFAAIWPRVYLLTMGGTYPGESATTMVIFRHNGLPLALNDAVWTKYNLGEQFKINAGDAPATKNPYATITGLPLPGLGVAELLKTGTLIGACDVAMTVYSSAAATKMGLKAEDVKKEWIAGLLPGVQLVPSGVMAVARAQELGAQYIFAG
ncbi:MAG TPA: twin-arginine translocation signal domain-containing protein [Gemmatimonadaceae bacterium]|nr:twin-arginine translocation signal domain-containing protein [Gemmatimonadaceae bacterium]